MLAAVLGGEAPPAPGSAVDAPDAVAEAEELARRASYHGATVERITIWATDAVTYWTKPEVIAIPPTEHDRRPLEWEGGKWSVTLFGGVVQQQGWSATVELDSQSAGIPLREVGRLPGDAPAPFREAFGTAQWKCVALRKAIQFLSGVKLTDITPSRTEQTEIELLATPGAGTMLGIDLELETETTPVPASSTRGAIVLASLISTVATVRGCGGGAEPGSADPN